MEIGMFGKYGSDDVVSYWSDFNLYGWCAVGLAWWSYQRDVNWSGDNVKLISNGGSGFVVKIINAPVWKIGDKASVSIYVSLTSGSLIFHNGNGVILNIIGSGFYTVYFTVVNLAINFQAVNFLGSVDSFSIKKLVSEMGGSSVGDPVELL